ncbi:MAG: TetR/AcrR family transcriptional regulator [Clostridiales bacterium]|nr:TetR/AcrR family transcriptional regulator [Clostridiales bacterium]
MRKQPEVTDATREAFIDAFFQLAKGKSINRITIRETTSLAGYNRTTFYRYFEDVYALVEYAEDEFLQMTRKTAEDRYGKMPLGERQFFETIISCCHQNKDRVSILMSEQNRAHFMRKAKDNVGAYLNWNGSDTPKKRIIRDVYFYGIFHAISINLQSQDALPDEDLLDMIQTMFTSWYLPEMTRDA